MATAPGQAGNGFRGGLLVCQELPASILFEIIWQIGNRSAVEVV
jgi:hypothetical protein